MNGTVFSELVDQDAAIAEIKRAAKAARLLIQAEKTASSVGSSAFPSMAGSSALSSAATSADVLGVSSSSGTSDASGFSPVNGASLTSLTNLTNLTNDTASGNSTALANTIPLANDAASMGSAVPINSTTAANTVLSENTVPSENDAASTENAISTKATAMTSQAMSHAWLITGPPGSGRSLAARAFAAALECTDMNNLGCGQCSACKAVMSGNHPDVEITATDAVTISAQEVRNLVAQAYLAPSAANWRIFIIEDADRMLSRTTNVLLKAIEEPAAHTVWILCTTAPADVLPTIRSRCRNINLITPSPQAVAALLEKRDGATHEEALVAAQAAQSHIGVARALLHNPSAKALRKRTLTALVGIRGIGDAVVSAKAFTDADYMLAPIDPIETDATQTEAAAAEAGGNTGNIGKAKNAKDSAKIKSTAKNAMKTKYSQAEADETALERARIAKMEALGLDPNGKIPAALRAQIGGAAEAEKRRKTRALHDLIDRELIYLTSYFRDVLMLQVGASLALINPDFRKAIEERAGSTKATQTLKVLDAISEARARLNANVTPQLLLESVLIETFLATHSD